MRREHLRVDLAGDGAEAIELLKQHSYSVVLLDLMMPRVDGFGVIEHLCKHPPARKPVVLVITAYADQKFKEVNPAIAAGVLRKPFEIADVGNLVKQCVEGLQNAAQVRRGADDDTLRLLPVKTVAGR